MCHQFSWKATHRNKYWFADLFESGSMVHWPNIDHEERCSIPMISSLNLKVNYFTPSLKLKWSQDAHKTRSSECRPPVLPIERWDACFRPTPQSFSSPVAPALQDASWACSLPRGQCQILIWTLRRYHQFPPKIDPLSPGRKSIQSGRMTHKSPCR